jgi:lipid-A-disaccharide synthase
VVCYRANPISIAIARKLVKVPYISLVNLIAGKEVVKELIQQAFNSVNLEKELRPLLTEGSPKRTEMLREYELLRRQLGGSGVSERVAANMITLLKAGNHL